MRIMSLAELGPILRQTRRDRGLTMEDVMFAANVSKTFVIDAEAGKPTCQFDRVLRVAQVVGVSLTAQAAPNLEDAE